MQEKSASIPKDDLVWAGQNVDTACVSTFFVKFDDGSLQAVVLVKDMLSEKLPAIFHNLEFSIVDSEWQVGTVNGMALPAGLVDSLKTQVLSPKPAPVFFESKPREIVAALMADKKFNAQTSASLTGALLKELGDIEHLEIRGTPNAQAFRVVALIKAAKESPLETFLNQRLPAGLPDEHGLMPVSNASAYGYFSYNPVSLSKYIEHLSGVFGQAMPVAAKQMLDMAAHLDCAKGYSAFLQMPDETAPRVFYWGSWNRSNTPEFILSMYAALHPMMNVKEIEVQQAFLLGEAPVWRLRPPESKEKIIPAPPPPPNVFFSVSQGNITQSSSPEALSQFAQDLAPPAIDNNSLSKNFGHLPTLCFQAKYKTDSLLQALLLKTPETPTSSYMYAAASLGEGQLGITVDVPYELMAQMLQMSK